MHLALFSQSVALMYNMCFVYYMYNMCFVYLMYTMCFVYPTQCVQVTFHLFYANVPLKCMEQMYYVKIKYCALLLFLFVQESMNLNLFKMNFHIKYQS